MSKVESYFIPVQIPMSESERKRLEKDRLPIIPRYSDYFLGLEIFIPGIGKCVPSSSWITLNNKTTVSLHYYVVDRKSSDEKGKFYWGSVPPIEWDNDSILCKIDFVNSTLTVKAKKTYYTNYFNDGHQETYNAAHDIIFLIGKHPVHPHDFEVSIKVKLS